MEISDPASRERRFRWSLKISGEACIWELNINPSTLKLYVKDTKVILAVFDYGEKGNQARNGEAVGGLRILRDDGDKDREEIVCSLVAALVYWEGTGRMLWNRVTGARGGVRLLEQGEIEDFSDCPHFAR